MTNQPVPANDVMQPSTMIAVIERAASNPDVDVAKMEKLLEMQMTIMTKQAEMAFNQAMTRLQAVLPTVEKNGTIKFTDKNGQERNTPFARYEDIDEAIRPLMIKEGFSISFDSSFGESGVIISGTLSHQDGHHRTSTMRLPLDTSGSKNNLQAMGSTLSYGKRYLVGMLLNIVTKGEDDDGARSDAVDTEQAATLDTLIRESKADRAKFLALFGVTDVRLIPAEKYTEAKELLEKKKAKK